MDFELTVPIAKVDKARRVVYGWASVAESGDKLVVDSHGERIAPAELEKAAHGFMADSRDGALLHQLRGTGRIVESIVFTKEKQKALGIDLGKVGWWIGYEVTNPAVMQAVEKGQLRAFSIGGRGVRREAAEVAGEAAVAKLAGLPPLEGERPAIEAMRARADALCKSAEATFLARSAAMLYRDAADARLAEAQGV